MLTVYDSWIPNHSEPKMNDEIRAYLESRSKDVGIYTDERGGESLAWALAHQADMDVELRGPWVTDGWTLDLRDILLAEALSANCNALIWWQVRTSKHPWVFYAGQWDDRVGFACLRLNDGTLPMVWTSPYPAIMRKTYDLKNA